MRTVELKITNRTYQILWSLARQQSHEEHETGKPMTLVPLALLSILKLTKFAGGLGTLDIKLSDSELLKEFPECSREELRKIGVRIHRDISTEEYL